MNKRSKNWVSFLNSVEQIAYMPQSKHKMYKYVFSFFNKIEQNVNMLLIYKYILFKLPIDAYYSILYVCCTETLTNCFVHTAFLIKSGTKNGKENIVSI